MRVPADRYRSAEQLLRHNRASLVGAARVRPRWHSDGRFTYRCEDRRGHRFVLVDPTRATRGPAFDHDRLAAALTAASGEQVTAGALPISDIDPDGPGAVFSAFGRSWAFDGWSCRERGPGPVTADAHVVTSPDGRHHVRRHDFDLWSCAADGTGGRALTTDGGRDRDYGANPDYFMHSAVLSRLGLTELPPAVAWSPDSTRLLTHRTSHAGVRRMHLVDALPVDGGAPGLRSYRYARPGDAHIPMAAMVVIDAAAGTVVAARADTVPMPMMSPITRGWAWWDDDGTAVYYLHPSRDQRRLTLYRMDPDSGRVRMVHTETGPTRVEPSAQFHLAPMVRVFDGGRSLVWFSQRNGHGHLYLYDHGAGEPSAELTSGPCDVTRILHLDPDRGELLAEVTGLVQADPYRRTICRVALDGSGLTPLTDDGLDHEVVVSPDGAHLLDSASTTSDPPVTVLRDRSGAILLELERADDSALRATGWRPPERVTATGADGRTRIEAMLHLPHDFDPSSSYPVLDHPYGFPTAHRLYPTFEPTHYGADAEAVAALGFVVLAVDGSGSPGRGKAFHDRSYGRTGTGGLDDHVAVLRELAATRPWMDIERVGAFGASAGGFATVRLMLDHPDLFRAGVAEEGMHDLRLGEAGVAEAYQARLGPGDYVSNVDDAEKLRGRLLLVHGGLDDSVPAYLSLRLAERLIVADRDVEMLLVPGADHSFMGYEHHVVRRRWDFLVRHVMRAEPPEEFRLDPVPATGPV